MLETLDDCALESSAAWNNAGTGHAANCELNYTPQQPDGTVDISRALEVNTEFDVSRSFWSYLVESGAIADPRLFVHECPHMSFVWGSGERRVPAQAIRSDVHAPLLSRYGIQRPPR